MLQKRSCWADYSVMKFDTPQMCEIGWRQEHMPTWQLPDLDQPGLGLRSLLTACPESMETRYHLQGFHLTFPGTLQLLAADWDGGEGRVLSARLPSSSAQGSGSWGGGCGGSRLADCVPGVAALHLRSFYAAAVERC